MKSLLQKWNQLSLVKRILIGLIIGIALALRFSAALFALGPFLAAAKAVVLAIVGVFSLPVLLTALGVTGVLSGLNVSYIMPLAISEGASSYLNRTVIFDPSILRTPGMMICGISVVVVIIAQLIMRKTARKLI